MKRKRLTHTNQVKVAGTGLYGSTKALDRTIQASIRKVQRKARKIARSLYAKDSNTAAFLATHAKRGKSPSAQIIVNAMQDMGPKFASDKTASYGMYGFSKKTAQRSISACAEMKNYVGSISSDLHRRKFDKYDAMVSYLKSHKKEAKCPCAAVILQFYPSRDMRLATDKDSLRDRLVRLAYQKPHLRKHISSLIEPSEEWIYWSDWE